jgi:hypothetical protein
VDAVGDVACLTVTKSGSAPVPSGAVVIPTRWFLENPGIPVGAAGRQAGGYAG